MGMANWMLGNGSMILEFKMEAQSLEMIRPHTPADAIDFIMMPTADKLLGLVYVVNTSVACCL